MKVLLNDLWYSAVVEFECFVASYGTTEEDEERERYWNLEFQVKMKGE